MGHEVEMTGTRKDVLKQKYKWNNSSRCQKRFPKSFSILRSMNGETAKQTDHRGGKL